VQRAVAQSGLTEEDRNNLPQVVSQRTGLPPDGRDEGARSRQAGRRYPAAKTGAYLSFWTFMSLLFGAAAAVLGGIVGGELRDSWRSPPVQAD
jgi:hypothetical protein